MHLTLSDQQVLIGEDAAGGRLGAVMSRQGWGRVAVFASPSIAAAGLIDRLREQAFAHVEIAHVVDDIAGHAPIPHTESIAAELRGTELDAVVAIGGGSVSDTAKAVAILLAEGGGLEEHCSVFIPPDQLDPKELRAPKLPVVAVPTTLSAAEVTPGGGATTADGVKRTFWDPQLASRVIAFDPAVLRTVPAPILVSTGMNALAHCAEGLYSRTANPLSSALATAATRHLAAGLRAVADEVRSDDALEDLSVGAFMSGLVITNARVGLHHAICHVLGARCGVPHGVANSVMLPSVLRYNLEETRDAQQVFAAALTGSTDGADPAGTVEAFRETISAPARLRDVGVEREEIPAIAADTLQDRGCFFNPRRVTDASAIEAVLERAW